MDREKIISKLEKEVQRTYSIKTTVFQNGKKVSEEINTHREPCVRIQIEMADEIIALLKEQKWIPVTERIPADGSDILVYCDDGEESRIVACNYDNGVWFDCVFNTLMMFKNITHWMPLPKPPKKEGR